MKIGIIGAGRVGCSLGKYFAEHGIEVSGYYDTSAQAAKSAAEFAGTAYYEKLDELVSAGSMLFITTPDGAISGVWERMRGLPLLNEKIICHCSGALSSHQAFSGIEATGASGCSVHPMLPFSNRFSSFSQLNHAFLTVEGQEAAVQAVKALFEPLGNAVCVMDSKHKAAYHAAASILSNQVVAVLDTGYAILESCGFSREEAVEATAELVRANVENVLRQGCMGALTGPIERGDLETVKKHMECLDGEDLEMYRVLAKKLVGIASRKHPEADYGKMRGILDGKPAVEKAQRRDGKPDGVK